MRKHTTPKTFAQLVQAIDRAGRLDQWAIGTLPAEPDDNAKTRHAMWLAGGDHEDAEHGWSWQWHIAGKIWCKPEHLALLDALCAAIPASIAARA